MIPEESNKELFVTVDDASVNVAISPPVLDAVIVSGVPPVADPNTLLFVDYDPVGKVLHVSTVDGRAFNIYNTTDPVNP
jgi:hypothetical protein